MPPCPECGAPLSGLRETCSVKCRQHRSRRLRAERARAADEILTRVARDVDGEAAAELAYAARRYLAGAQ